MKAWYHTSSAAHSSSSLNSHLTSHNPYLKKLPPTPLFLLTSDLAPTGQAKAKQSTTSSWIRQRNRAVSCRETRGIWIYARGEHAREVGWEVEGREGGRYLV